MVSENIFSDKINYFVLQKNDCRVFSCSIILPLNAINRDIIGKALTNI
jgi:hypothetical protein